MSEELIEAVKKFEVLYNYKHIDYKDLNVRNAAWEEISNIVKMPDHIPVRLGVGAMIFTATWMSYMMRVNMSINIIAMVQPSTNGEGTRTRPECANYTMAQEQTSFLNKTYDTHEDKLPDYGERYAWSSETQGMVLGSYFWGYLVTSLPGGILADYFGGTRLVGFSVLLSAAITTICPAAAAWHYGALIAARFALGFLAGVLYPALHNLIARWAPPDEKGKFVSALLGGTFGTVVTWSFTGYLIEKCGWKWAFYAPGAIAAIWSGLWFLILSDDPAHHRFINSSEADYIAKSQGGSVSNSKKMPPFKRLIMSGPFWSLFVLHFGSAWGLQFLLTSAPKFLTEVLGFDIRNAGFLSGLPYLMRMIMGILFGAVGDVLRNKNYLSVTNVRKLFCIFSHVIPGLFLFGLGNVGCAPILSVTIITLSLGFNGASTMTNLQNSQDLAPNFAGTIYGIVNCFGSASGFISPALVGYFIRDHNGLEEWHKIFLVGAFVYIVPSIWFAIFGSGEVQSWNEVKTDEAENNTSESKEHSKATCATEMKENIPSHSQIESKS